MTLFQIFSNAQIDSYHIDSDKDVIESSKLMGIGLAFWQKMLTKMKSQLELSSVIGVGSTFSFRIKWLFTSDKNDELTISKQYFSSINEKNTQPICFRPRNLKHKVSVDERDPNIEVSFIIPHSIGYKAIWETLRNAWKAWMW